MAFELFIFKRMKKRGTLNGMLVGEIRSFPWKTKKQISDMIKLRIRKFGEVYSWDENAKPIVVRRDK